MQLLARSERHAELGLFVINKVTFHICSFKKLWHLHLLYFGYLKFNNGFILLQILEPSLEVALQLLEPGRQNFQTRKLGLDMLRQLSLHHEYVLLLVQDGYYLEALRYTRKHKVLFFSLLIIVL